MFRRGESTIGTLNTSFLIGTLLVDPVAKIAVDELFKRPPTFATGCSETMVVNKGMETVATAIPDVPNERPLAK